MTKSLLVISFLAIATSAAAQVCTPNPLYTDSIYGVWPDTTTNFANGTVGTPYFQQMDIKVPSDASVLGSPGITIHSVFLQEITGLPPGITYACATQTANPCTYLANALGCGVLQGTPTTAGTYNLTLKVLPFITLFGAVFESPDGPVDFGGYRIVISDGVGILEQTAPGLANVRNVPNPFGTRTSIEFQLPRATDVTLSVYNLLGEELWNQNVQGRAGINKVPFESGTLPEGVYLYKVRSGKDTFTGRMVLNR